MTERIHDDEPDTGEAVIRALLAAECSSWANRPVSYIANSGTDNAMWRIRLDDEPDVVIRLPRRPGAAAGADQEIAVLQRIKRSPLPALVKTRSYAMSASHTSCSHIAGRSSNGSREPTPGPPRHDLHDRDLRPLATDLAAAVNAIGAITDIDVTERTTESRGGLLAPVLNRLLRWLDDPTWNAKALVDVAAVRRLVAEALEVDGEPVQHGFVHGDLIPGNLLVEDGRLRAIIDWGGVGHGDLAQDLAPAWSVLTAVERHVFRQGVGADDAAWIRGRAIELEHAVGGVLYYRPRRHPLGDVMARTLDRILADR